MMILIHDMVMDAFQVLVVPFADVKAGFNLTHLAG
jgi:hypothetical protein